MDIVKLLEISEMQKDKLKADNKCLRKRISELQDKVKELLCQSNAINTKQE